MLTSTFSVHVSAYFWGWISHEGTGILPHTEDHLDGLQYWHISKNVMVPSVRVPCPDGVIQFQQDHSSSHAWHTHVVQEWLLWQANIKLIAWPLQVPDQKYVKWGKENHAKNPAWYPSKKKRYSRPLYHMLGHAIFATMIVLSAATCLPANVHVKYSLHFSMECCHASWNNH